MVSKIIFGSLLLVPKGAIYYGKKTKTDNFQNLSITETDITKYLEKYYHICKIILWDIFITSIKLDLFLSDKNVGSVEAWKSKSTPSNIVENRW